MLSKLIKRIKSVFGYYDNMSERKILLLLREFYRPTSLYSKIIDVRVEETSNKCSINMKVTDPGMFIGMRGKYAKELGSFISTSLRKEVRINIKQHELLWET